jgi:TnpA family transposase
MRGDRSKRLTILSASEKCALYGLPDFDDFQRADFFAMTHAECALALRRNGLEAQIFCLLQIGYFKAKQAFFKFTLQDVSSQDIHFLLERYFPDKTLVIKRLSENEYYAPRKDIAALFGYRLWSDSDSFVLREKATLLAKTDITTAFILTEIISFLIAHRIVRPGYSTLQAIIADALSTERERLEQQLSLLLDDSTQASLQKLLVREDALSELASIKQDAKHFGYRMMVTERQKRTILSPLYLSAKALLPKLGISSLNISHYASLANFYTIYDLRRLKPYQAYLYLLCYVWLRYRQLSDNLVDAFGYQLKQLDEESKEASKQQAAKAQVQQQQAVTLVGELLMLYVDDAFADNTPFGLVRHRAFSIMPEDILRSTGKLLCLKPISQMDLRWQAIDQQARRCTKNIRPLAMALDFNSRTEKNPWIDALRWMKKTFQRQQRLVQRPLEEIPTGTIDKRLRPYLFHVDQAGEPISLRGERYEFLVYRQLRKLMDMGEIYFDDSVQHRCFTDELVTLSQQSEVLTQLNIPWLRQSTNLTLKTLLEELDVEWRAFDRELRQGKLKHLLFDQTQQTLTWHRPKADPDDIVKKSFYGAIPSRDITDVFRFVNEECHFLSVMTPLQPRYAKKIADQDSLMAVIMAQAMNHGNFSIAETGDIPYHVLDATHKQHVRLATLKAANDHISNFIAKLPIFPCYSFDLEVLYGSVDGQKFAAASPTTKARFSRKYFGKDRGVVAYSFLANHVALQTELIGANQHESYWVFDICYNNTSDITPTMITGDMHSINKVNFAILQWFGMKLAPRFTTLQTQLKHLYCGVDPENYAKEKFLIMPTGQIDCELILSEKDNIDRIVATLGLKEMSQSVLVRKLCTMSLHHRTRRAVFEFDKLVRSLYTLRYFRDPQLQRNVHRSQNRIEGYHQLRSAIAQVGGKKEIIGHTDLDIAISNQCGRLLANVVIAYNSILLSKLLSRYSSAGNQKALERIKRISPVAWQHIYFLGHYTFRNQHRPFDLEAMLDSISVN